MREMKPAIVATLVAVAVLSGGRASADAVVFGSYANVRFAEDKRAEVTRVLGVAADIVPVDVGGSRYLRVVGPRAATPGEQRALLQRARDAGLEAWYWRGNALAVGASDGSATAPIPTPQPRAPAPPDASPATGPATGPAGADWALALTPQGGSAPTIDVVRIAEANLDITLDGRLDEAVWREVPGYDNMTVIDPDTLAEPAYRTVARYVYSERGLYIGVWNEQPPETLIARLSSRDDYINRDSWGITLDTSGEGLYGYWFTVNLGGSVMDGKVAPEREFSREWDGPWESETAVVADGWTLELFLPWSMMTMPQNAGDRRMGFWVNRKVAHLDERYSWPALPFTGARFMSALGDLSVPDVVPKQQLAIFPYASVTYDHIVEDVDYKGGVDVFWRPTSNLQVTATATPDFGAVESDDVVVNLTSTETFFPEKRLFFLEGNEIFITSPRSQTRGFGGSGGSASSGARRTASTFNPRPTTVLNTRRIGGAPIIDVPDGVAVESQELAKPTDLLGAGKLTGQAGPVRYGVLGAVEDDPELRGEVDGEAVKVDGVGRDFGVARVLLESANAGRRSVGYIGTIMDHPDRQAIVHGVDGHYLSAGGRLKGDVQMLYSDVEDVAGYGGFADFSYTPKRGTQHEFSLDYRDRKLEINDLGFLERNDFYGGRYALSLTRSNLRRFRQLRTQFNLGHWLNHEDRNVRTGIFLRNALMFNNRSEIRTEINYFPERWEDLESRGNGSYKVRGRWVGELAYGTDTSKKLSWSVQGGAREEDIRGINYLAAVGFTFKPADRFSLDFDVNYRRRGGWLLHQGGTDFTLFEAHDLQPRIALDLFLSARQQLRLTMQWAGIVAEEKRFYTLPADGDVVEIDRDPTAPTDDFTISRLTAQLRYRWEIAPLSDLFLVYTRGSNLANRIDDEFGDLFSDALRDPIVDVIVLKLRYRFGT